MIGEPLTHILGFGEAAKDTAMAGLFFKTTSSVLAGHVPFEIVQTKVTVVLLLRTPVTVVVGEVGIVITAPFEAPDHKPVPTEGVFAVMVNVPLAQLI